jgi:hypothetical protein
MFTLSRSVRRTVLTTHIVVSVGLLGDSAGLLAIALRTATTDDPALSEASHETMALLSGAFGIPLSVLAILTGVVLGLGSRWGVFRYPWVTAKLALIVSVMVVGALVIGPSEGRPGREGLIVAGAAYDVVALTLATGLSVFRPGGRRRPYPRRDGSARSVHPARP